MNPIVGQALEKFVRVFPEYDVYADGGSYDQPSAKYLKLCKVFHEIMSDRQIRWFKAMWFKWQVEDDPTAQANVKSFIKQYIED